MVAVATKEKVTLRQAAYQIAVERVARAEVHGESCHGPEQSGSLSFFVVVEIMNRAVLLPPCWRSRLRFQKW